MTEEVLCFRVSKIRGGTNQPPFPEVYAWFIAQCYIPHDYILPVQVTGSRIGNHSTRLMPDVLKVMTAHTHTVAFPEIRKKIVCDVMSSHGSLKKACVVQVRYEKLDLRKERKID